ncbi:MAG: hypothetical protein FWB96_09650 [Defluviitaleaceae bacterium]|nr:hypothetical protein [Defluviitaleaceae bacterium]MCL2263121.1 hypothetical protein [Defluviitaleaceae bacterium]
MEPLKQAKELVEQILLMTQGLVLTGVRDAGEEESEAYSLLMDEREPLIDELTDLRTKIDDTEAASAEFEAITQTIQQITALDKKHIAVMERLHKNVQSSYKDVKQGQRIHAGYNPVPDNEYSSKIDLKH